MDSLKPKKPLRATPPLKPKKAPANLLTIREDTMSIDELIKKYGEESLDSIEKMIADDMKLAASAYRSYIEMLFYMEHTKRYKHSEGFEKATFDDYLRNKFNIAPHQYYAARKIYVQYPDEASWLGVYFLQKVQKDCGVEAIPMVVEEIREKESKRTTPLSVADREKIAMKYKKPPTPAEIARRFKNASYWKAKYLECKRQLDAALQEIDEKDEQIAKLKATVEELKMKMRQQYLRDHPQLPAATPPCM